MNVSASIQRENLCTICHLFDAEYVCNKCEDEQFCSKCYEKEHAVSPLLQRHQRLAVSINPALMTVPTDCHLQMTLRPFFEQQCILVTDNTT
jgi:hypothetical protein